MSEILFSDAINLRHKQNTKLLNQGIPVIHFLEETMQIVMREMASVFANVGKAIWVRFHSVVPNVQLTKTVPFIKHVAHSSVEMCVMEVVELMLDANPSITDPSVCAMKDSQEILTATAQNHQVLYFLNYPLIFCNNFENYSEGSTTSTVLSKSLWSERHLQGTRRRRRVHL